MMQTSCFIDIDKNKKSTHFEKLKGQSHKQKSTHFEKPKGQSH